MRPDPKRTCTAFSGHEKIAEGLISDVALTLKKRLTTNPKLSVLVFDDETSAQVELDLRGAPEDILARLEPVETESEEKKAGPGRPKMGVVAREITLLPRHWEWLATQPGGASATLRKLIEDAKRLGSDKDRRRRAQEAAHKFMSAMAGNLPLFEEALRALYAGQREPFKDIIAGWPRDLKNHVMKLASEGLT